MGLYQSYMQVFVTNSPALLAQGQTVDNLAVGQIGFLDAKTYKAVTAPTYAKNKALYAVWGTPDVTLGDFGGMPNENEYSKIIKGKLIKRFRSKKAQRGITPIYTVGWSGDEADTDTLFAKVGESKTLFVKLTGIGINKMYSEQGLVKQFQTTVGCIEDPNCSTDNCGTVDSTKLAKELADQINADKDFRKYIRAKALIKCTGSTPVVETTCYKFAITVCDTGDDLALGLIQAKYPLDKVNRTGRSGAISTYSIVRNTNTLPAAFVTSNIIVPDCPTCPIGATLVAKAKVFEVQLASEQALPVIPGQIGFVTLSTGPQLDVYTVTVSEATANQAVIDAVEAVSGVATFLGTKRDICQLPSVTLNFVADGTLKKQARSYRLTLADSVCGTDRLADLQAFYPSLVVSVVNAAGDCVHTYETSVESNCYEVGCAISAITFVKPPIFEGADWKEVVVEETGTDCLSGIQIETAFTNRKTSECTFDAFPYENDIVHVQISNYNPDYNADPCEGEWAVKQIRQVQYPQGHGQYIQHLEKESKQYDQRFRSTDAVVREAQGYSLQADQNKFYDEYVIEFDTKFKTSGGWSETTTQSFHLVFFVPEGQGQALENTLNSYVTSAGVEEDATSL